MCLPGPGVRGLQFRLGWGGGLVWGRFRYFGELDGVFAWRGLGLGGEIRGNFGSILSTVGTTISQNKISKSPKIS